MSTYPTPPPTSSPKYSQSQQEMPSQQPESQPFRPFTPERKAPAQETYWKEDYSAPSSPTHWDNGSKPLPPNANGSSYQPPPPPPRRQSSPIRIQTTAFRPLGGVQYGYDSAAEQIPYHYIPPAPAAPPAPPLPQTTQERRKSKSSRPVSPQSATPRAASPRLESSRPVSPPRPSVRPASSRQPSIRPISPRQASVRPGSPPSRAGSPRSPKPIYFSPTNPIPSPYSASRPQPRPGFLRRMLDKLREWINRFIDWATDNPVKAGLFSFLPLLAAAGFVKGASKVVGAVGKGLGIKGFGFKGLGNVGKGWNTGEGEWEYGMKEFVGFGGTKAGPIDGFMKVLHMLMDHWCKLTPSAIPRTASILLQLYFLETGKK